MAGSAAAAFCLTWLVFNRIAPIRGSLGFLIVAYVVFLLVYWLVVHEAQGSLIAADRLFGVLVASGALLALAPLLLVLWFVVSKGAEGLSTNFFTETLEKTGPDDPATAGGGWHSIVGTFQQVGFASAVAIPLGILTAVYINEVRGRLRRMVRFLVDSMSGVPSIVAGLFVYAVWILELDNGFSGFACALALSMMMLPTVTRTAEEVLRLVPGGLREASLALGATEWRTTLRVVLPTARSGLVTASLLAVARVAGETAPAVLTAGQRNSLNTNLFSGNQQNLPLMIWQSIRTPTDSTVARGYTAALVLVGLVLVLFVSARVLSAGSPLASAQRVWKWLRARRRRDDIVVDLRDPVDPLTGATASAIPDPLIWKPPVSRSPDQSPNGGPGR